MSFSGLILTNLGRNELIRAELGATFNITHIILGDGTYTGAYTAIQNVVNPIIEMPVTHVYRDGEEVYIECDFASTEMPKAFYLREIGIIANDVLCYYDNSREDAEFIDPASETLVKQKRMRFVLLISSEIQINVSIKSSLYALATDLIVTQENMTEHIENTANPHQVTKEQVGLGNVNNTADMDKPISTAVQVVLDTLSKQSATLAEEQSEHIENTANPHQVTKEQVGLGNVNNTADMDKPISTAVQNALDLYYEQSTAYSDKAVADLVNGAPETMDTLKEVSEALAENEDVVAALNAAIGTKANQTEVDTHTKNGTIHITATEREKWNGTLASDGDSQNNTVTFTSGDSTSPTAWSEVTMLKSGEKHSSILNKISTMFKNIRYLYKILGTTDISTIGDGTATGAISELNTNLSTLFINTAILSFGVSGEVKCLKKGNVIRIKGHVTGSLTANTYVTIATIPSDYILDTNYLSSYTFNIYGTVGYLYIHDGVVEIYSSSSNYLQYYFDVVLF